MAAMLEIKNLTKRFGPVVAVDDVSFDVDRGAVLGFLGPNGAGKSTTMKMITGFLSPTSGSMRVCGHDVLQDPLATKRRIGYLPEGAPAYPDMTPHGYLNFIADILDEAKTKGTTLDSTHLGEIYSISAPDIVVDPRDVRTERTVNISFSVRSGTAG